jgi:hypothetical protein
MEALITIFIHSVNHSTSVHCPLEGEKLATPTNRINQSRKLNSINIRFSFTKMHEEGVKKIATPAVHSHCICRISFKIKYLHGMYEENL